MSGLWQKGFIEVLTGSVMGGAIAQEWILGDLVAMVTNIDGKMAEPIAQAIGGESHVLNAIDSSPLRGVADTAADAHGGLDALVSNASISIMQSFLALSEDDVVSTYDRPVRSLSLRSGSGADNYHSRLGEQDCQRLIDGGQAKPGTVPRTPRRLGFGAAGLTQAMAFELASHERHSELLLSAR
jgi:NAD(P)-dependent dehydrogenase (short-subunit alcohol dehydrogenase family)